MKRKHISKPDFASISILCAIILIFAFDAEAQVCTPAPVGLAAWYRAENNLLDARGGNNAGTPANPMSYAAGHAGQAFSVSFGSNQNIWTAPDAPSFNQQTFTIEGWIKTTGIHSGSFIGFIAAKSGLDAGSGYEFAVGSPAQNGRLRFLLNGGAGGADFLGTTTVTDNIFHHVAATYDGTTMKLYVDGALDAQHAVTLTIDYPAGRPFTIYNRQLGSGVPTNLLGLIDELSFYNRALSLAEIQAINTAGTAGKCNPTSTVAPSGLVGFWGGDGDANDTSGNSNNGTVSNGAGFAVSKVGQGFTFDGLDDSVSIPDSPNLDLLTGGTIEAWVYLNNLSNSAMIGKGRSDTNEASYTWGIYNGDLRFDLYNGDATVNVPVTTPAASLVGSWNHIAVNWDATNIRIFVNGVQTAAGTYGFVRLDTTYPVTFGKNYPGAVPLNGKLDEVSIYDRALSLSEIQSIYNAGLAGKLKVASTPTGFAQFADGKSGSFANRPESVTTAVGDATVTFQSVTTAGMTQEIPLDLSLLPPLPMGVTSTGLTYDLATSAAYSGVDVCFNLPSFTPAQFANLRVYHLEGGTWVNRTAASNTSPTLCTTGVTSLSPFAIGSVAPTAANVSVSGRIFDAFGNGIPKVRVSITGTNGISRTIATSPFGYYRFDDITAGETCVISVESKRYTFSQPVRIITVNDVMENVDFQADSSFR